MSIPEDRTYTNDHEWAKDEGGRVRIGISEYAQQVLGDVVFVELPEVGASCTAGQSFATVESVKAVSDIYAPVSGRVVEVNQALSDAPQAINESPYEEGWIAIIEPEGALPESLLSAGAYGDYLKQISK